MNPTWLGFRQNWISPYLNPAKKEFHQKEYHFFCIETCNNPRMLKDSYFASLITRPYTPQLICLPSAALCPQWPLWPPYPTKLRCPLKPQFTCCIIVRPSKWAKSYFFDFWPWMASEVGSMKFEVTSLSSNWFSHNFKKFILRILETTKGRKQYEHLCMYVGYY